MPASVAEKTTSGQPHGVVDVTRDTLSGAGGIGIRVGYRDEEGMGS